MLKNILLRGKNIQFVFFLSLFFLSVNCSKKDSLPLVPTGQSKKYAVFNTDLSDITGTVNFVENTDGSTTISLQLSNTIKDIDNLVRIRRNTANFGGGIAIVLEAINGSNGTSNTTISKLSNGESIGYLELVDFNGYISIIGESENEGVLYAYADLGPNELTGKKVTYDLFSPDNTFNGLVTLEERKKGTASLTIGLVAKDDESELACTLHIFKDDSGEEEYIHELSPITSDSNGFSFNELTEVNGGPITFDEVLGLNAYIIVSNGLDANSVFAKAIIGSN